MGDKCVRLLCILPSLYRAGAETQLVDLVEGLAGEDFRITVISFEAGMDLRERVARSARYLHIPRQRKVDLALSRKIARVIDDEQIDVVHCTLEIALFAGWFARRFARRKPVLVSAIHTTIHRNLKDVVFDRLIYRRMLMDCRKVIFVCKSQAARWNRVHRRLGSRSIVIYNGVNHERFNPALFADSGQEFRKLHGIPGDARVVLCIAAFRPEKGHDILVRAFAALPDTAWLVLVGDGEGRAVTESEIRRAGLYGRVIMTGILQDVRPALAAADVLVLASTAVETFSIAMLEAMSMQVPVVARDIGGLREAVVPGRTGELVYSPRPEELQAALSRVLSDPVKLDELGKNARIAVLDNFTTQGMVGQTRQVLLDVAREQFPEQST